MALLATGFASNIFAQQNTNFVPQPRTVTYANEVYSSYDQYKTLSHLQSYEAFIARVSIVHIPYSSSETYKLLSTVPLKNKYNVNLQYDHGTNFNMNTFNPLKYLFSQYPQETVHYRIDGTDYVVKIIPQ
jgi:hypothetical protein